MICGFLFLLILSVVCRHCGSHAVVPLIVVLLCIIVATLTAMPSFDDVLLLLMAIFFILVDRQQVFLAVLASNFVPCDVRCCPLLSQLPALFLCISNARVLGDLHVGVD